jgi:hypothetical protein
LQVKALAPPARFEHVECPTCHHTAGQQQKKLMPGLASSLAPCKCGDLI